MTLLVLPNVLGPVDPAHWLAPVVGEAVAELDGLMCESERAGRRYLSAFTTKLPADKMPISVMPKRPKKDDVEFLLEPVVAGETWGVISDAGLPCLADPGAEVVMGARRRGIPIRGYPGPSAPMLALMLSGFSGQRFSFHGYLRRERRGHLIEMELRSIGEGAPQLFMETPYRNDSTLAELVETLQPTTRLAVAWNLTLPEEQVQVGPIAWWKKRTLPQIHKAPCIFIIASSQSRRASRRSRISSKT